MWPSISSLKMISMNSEDLDPNLEDIVTKSANTLNNVIYTKVLVLRAGQSNVCFVKKDIVFLIEE